MQERVKGGGGVHDPLKFKVRIKRVEKREDVELKIRSSSGLGYGGGEKTDEVELKICSSSG